MSDKRTDAYGGWTLDDTVRLATLLRFQGDVDLIDWCANSTSARTFFEPPNRFLQ